MTKKKIVTCIDYSITEFNHLVLYGDGNLSTSLKIPHNAQNVNIVYVLGPAHDEYPDSRREVVHVNISWDEAIND